MNNSILGVLRFYYYYCHEIVIASKFIALYSTKALETYSFVCFNFQVEYDFQFYKLEMEADVQLLVLSEGKSNILPADIVLPFQPSSVGSSEATAEALEAWRWYLATIRSLPHSIEPEMQKVRTCILLPKNKKSSRFALL